MRDAPASLQAIRELGQFQIVWPNEPAWTVPFRAVRLACPCATCIDELTGRVLLRPETVPEAVAPTELSLSGNYALKIQWSDGHNTGLYTWERLHDIAVDQARAASRAISPADA